MSEALRQYRSIFSLSLAGVMSTLVFFLWGVLNTLNHVDILSGYNQSKFVSDFMRSIFGEPTENQIVISMQLFLIASLFFLIFRICKDFTFIACITFGIYICIIFLVFSKFIDNPILIILFICFINILNSFLSKLRIIQIVFLALSILLLPSFTIIEVLVINFLHRKVKFETFFLNKFDIVIFDAILVSFFIMIFIYGVQTLDFFVNNGNMSLVLFIISTLLFALFALPFVLMKKCYAT